VKKPSRIGSFILGSLTTAALLLGVQGYRQAPRTLSASAPSSSIVFSTAVPARTATPRPTAKPTARPTSAPARAKTAAPARTVRSLPITTAAPRSGLSASRTATPRPSTYYVINMSSGVFHRPECSNAHAITQAKKKSGYFNRADLIRDGYRPCLNCDP